MTPPAPLADQVALLDRAAAFLDQRTRRPATTAGIAFRCRFAGNSLRELDLFLADAFVAAHGCGARRFSAAEAYRRAGAVLALDPSWHRRLRTARSLQNRLAFTPLAGLRAEDETALADAVRANTALYRDVARALLEAGGPAGHPGNRAPAR